MTTIWSSSRGAKETKDYSPLARFALAAHRAKGAAPVAVVEGTVFALIGSEAEAAAIEAVAPPDIALGLWPLRGASAAGVRSCA